MIYWRLNHYLKLINKRTGSWQGWENSKQNSKTSQINLNWLSNHDLMDIKSLIKINKRAELWQGWEKKQQTKPQSFTNN